MKYALGNMLNGGGLNADGLSLDLQFAADKTLTARKGPTPVLTRGSTGTFVGSNGLIQTAAVNAARFDHDPVTLASRGLLIEEGRTNLFQRSEEFDNSYWTKLRASVDDNATTSPAGDSAADKLIEDSSSGTHMAFRLLNTGALVAHTFSIYAKADGRNFLYLSCGDGFLANSTAFFNLSNGTLGTVGANATASISSLSNGWYRCSITATPTSTTGNGFYIQTASANGTISYQGDGTSGTFIWGAQLEAGSFPTSYIPTTTSALARSADVCSITGADFNSLNTSPSFSVLCNFSALATTQASAMAPVGLNQSSNAGVQFIKFNNSASFAVFHVSTSATIGSISSNVIAKSALAYDGDSVVGVLAGGAVSAETGASALTFVEITIGNTRLGGNKLSGHISAIRYYRKRLANDKLQALTA